MKCLQCESKNIVKNVRAVDKGHNNYKSDLELQVHENPNALIFKGTYYGVLKANVCVDCGFVMFSVSIADAKTLQLHQNKSS